MNPTAPSSPEKGFASNSHFRQLRARANLEAVALKEAEDFHFSKVKKSKSQNKGSSDLKHLALLKKQRLAHSR